MSDQQRRSVHALRVRQWLPGWDEIDFDAASNRRKPQPHFYMFSLRATELRSLTGIYRRSTAAGTPRVRDFGIQRRHNEDRSQEISRFVERGYPWSTLSATKRSSGRYNDLIKPGWLPTAIVLNILLPEDTRKGRSVHGKDLVEIETPESSDVVEVLLPEEFQASSWKPRSLGPFEVIDGQHRLWAFDDDRDDSEYELPVVAFHGLDLSWQAYLFYTINIKPKRINTSLAYDLYPLLRTADWLERAEEHVVYKETRAQELTETLWSYPGSSWYHRIDMLGERGRKTVTQAAWIRSLLATFVKSWQGSGVRIGGLFGAPVGARDAVLEWSRVQQSAVLIYLWRRLEDAISGSSAPWAGALRAGQTSLAEEGHDPAFAGTFTLTNSDQGVRGILAVTNDLCYVRADKLKLADWAMDNVDDAITDTALDSAVRSLRKTAGGKFLAEIAAVLGEYDWRSSAAPSLTEAEKQLKARFRGGTGYKEIRVDLLHHLAKGQSAGVAEAARAVIDTLDST